jgi:hypothetical protein
VESVRFTENWLRSMPAWSEAVRYRACRTAGTPKITAFCAVCCRGWTAWRVLEVGVAPVTVAPSASPPNKPRVARVLTPAAATAPEPRRKFRRVGNRRWRSVA